MAYQDRLADWTWLCYVLSSVTMFNPVQLIYTPSNPNKAIPMPITHERLMSVVELANDFMNLVDWLKEQADESADMQGESRNNKQEEICETLRKFKITRAMISILEYEKLNYKNNKRKNETSSERMRHMRLRDREAIGLPSFSAQREPDFAQKEVRARFVEDKKIRQMERELSLKQTIQESLDTSWDELLPRKDGEPNGIYYDRVHRYLLENPHLRRNNDMKLCPKLKIVCETFEACKQECQHGKQKFNIDDDDDFEIDSSPFFHPKENLTTEQR